MVAHLAISLIEEKRFLKPRELKLSGVKEASKE
jgi:hypothetical protein